MGRTADKRDYRPRLGAGLKRAVFALAIVVAAGLSSPVPSSARDAGVQLPLGSPRSLVLDEAHSHVILTGDPMVVTDYAGEIVATLDDEGGASGMVLDDGLLFVNGTLMRGLELHGNLAGAELIEETPTAPAFRVHSIGDVHPGMYRADDGGGASISGELYAIPIETLLRVVEGEPPGLYRGPVELIDGRVVPGILFDEATAKTHPEITELGGWREYLGSRSDVSKS